MKAEGTSCLGEPYQKAHCLQVSAWNFVNMVFFKQPYGFSLIGLIIRNIPIDWPKLYLSQTENTHLATSVTRFQCIVSGTAATNGWTSIPPPPPAERGKGAGKGCSIMR